MDSTLYLPPEAGEVFNMWYGFLSVALIVPLVQWSKKLLPIDLPTLSVVLSVALSFGVAYGLDYLLGSEMTIKDISLVALGTNATAQMIHSIWKTKVKNSLPKVG
ncbi:MAG: hypothetical protein P1R58_13575 [bacterium]|nr:hypothetical protein [bacterium]